MVEIVLVLSHGEDDLFPVERQFGITYHAVFQFYQCGNISGVDVIDPHGSSRAETTLVDLSLLEQGSCVVMVGGILFPLDIQYLLTGQLFFCLLSQCNCLGNHLLGGELYISTIYNCQEYKD